MAEDDVTPDAVDSDATTPRRVVGSAASRARRIGGAAQARSASGVAVADTETDGGTDTPTGRVKAPASLTKTAPARGKAAPDRGNAGTTEGTATEDDTATEKAPRHALQRGLRALPYAVAVLSLVVAAGLVVLVVRTFNDHHGGSDTSTRQEILAAAKTNSALILSYDYRTLAKNQADTDKHLTGQYRVKYDQAMTTVITPQAPPQKAVVVGQVVRAAITAVNGDQAVVLIYAQQSVTNVANTTPRLDLTNLSVTLTYAKNSAGVKTWLISDLSEVAG